MSIRSRLIVAVGLAVLPSLALAQARAVGPPEIKLYNMGEMKMISDTKYMTLYVYDADKPGRSACYGACAKAWPPMRVRANAKPVGKFTILKRNDGTLQWAYNGRPLYLSTRDEQPGEMMGEGVAGKWHYAEP